MQTTTYSWEGLGQIVLVQANYQTPPRDQLTRINVRPPLFHTHWIRGDGNCMFEAFAKAVFSGNGGKAGEVRARAVQWVRENSEFTLPFIEEENGESGQESLDRYCMDMSRQGVWGDNLMLEALCRSHNVAMGVLKQEYGRLMWSQHGVVNGHLNWVLLFMEHEHYENLLTTQDTFEVDVIG